MQRGELTRRDFNRLTAAAMGGLVAGTIAGCGGDKKPDAGAESGGAAGQPESAGGSRSDAATAELTEAEKILVEEPHVCRGMNACQGLGLNKENACAGQTACYTAVAHLCGGQNDCRGQGGCGDKIGQNACKGQGGCNVPLMSRDTWDEARASLEAALKKQDKTLGNPEQMGPLEQPRPE